MVTPSGVLSGGGVCRSSAGQEAANLMNGIHALRERNTAEMLFLSQPYEDMTRGPSANQEGAHLSQHLDLGFPNLQTCNKIHLCC